MSSKSTNDIQKNILKFLQNKRASNISELSDHIHQTCNNSDRKVNIKYIISRSLKNLEASGDITVHKTEQGSFARLTSTGRQKLRSLRLSEKTHLMPLGWDGKWRIAILDIPENDKEKRNALRYILKKASFICLKNSVWISPHPFEHMLETMKEDLELSTELSVIVTDYIDPASEEEFRKAFWK
jgi:DNA-binding transcriptional regulator PaaX